MRIRRRGAMLLILLLAGGCGLPSRKQSEFFTLQRIAPTAPPLASSGPPLAISGLELPPGFDRREIILRKANSGLEIREKQQWSALLEPLVLHTLAADLAARMPDGMVILPGQLAPAGAKRSIDVVFEELAAGPENAVTVDARWTLAGGSAHHEQFSVPIDSLASAAVADGTSRALALLSERILAGLQ